MSNFDEKFQMTANPASHLTSSSIAMPDIEQKAFPNENNEQKMQRARPGMLWSSLGGYSGPKHPATAKFTAGKEATVARKVVYNCDNGFQFSRHHSASFTNAKHTPNNGTTGQDERGGQDFNNGDRNVAKYIGSIECGENCSFLPFAQIDQQNRQSQATNSYGDPFQHQEPGNMNHGSHYGFAPGTGFQQQSYPLIPSTPRRPRPFETPQTPRDHPPRMENSLMGSRIQMAQLSLTPNIPIIPIQSAPHNRQFSQMVRDPQGRSAALGSPFKTDDRSTRRGQPNAASRGGLDGNTQLMGSEGSPHARGSTIPDMSASDDGTFVSYDHTQMSESALTAQSFNGESEQPSEDSTSRFRQTSSNLITSQAAKKRWSAARWRPPHNDNLPATDAEKLPYVLRVESAMMSAETAEDNPTSTHIKRWTKPAYPDDDIRAAAWTVVEATIALHTHGSTIPIYAFEKGDKHGFAQKDLRFHERMEQICECLARRKTLCTFVMSNDSLKIQNMIAAPMRTTWRCESNNRANNKKAERLAHMASLDHRFKTSREGTAETLGGEELKASSQSSREPERPRRAGRRNAVSLTGSGDYEGGNMSRKFQNGLEVAWRSQVEQDLAAHQNHSVPASQVQPKGMDLHPNTSNVNDPVSFFTQQFPGNAENARTGQYEAFGGSITGAYNPASGSRMQTQGSSSDEFQFDFADPQFIADLDAIIAANTTYTASFPQIQFPIASGALPQQDLSIDGHHGMDVLTEPLDPRFLEEIQGEKRKYEGEQGNGRCKVSKASTEIEHEALTADQQAGNQTPSDKMMK